MSKLFLNQVKSLFYRNKTRLIYGSSTFFGLSFSYFYFTERGNVSWHNASFATTWPQAATTLMRSLRHGDHPWELIRSKEVPQIISYFDKYPYLREEKSGWWLYSRRHPWGWWPIGFTRPFPFLYDSTTHPHVFGIKPIQWAIETGNSKDVVQYFINQGVDLQDYKPHQNCPWEHNLINVAIGSRNWPALRILLEAEAPWSGHFNPPYRAGIDYYDNLIKIGREANHIKFVSDIQRYRKKICDKQQH